MSDDRNKPLLELIGHTYDAVQDEKLLPDLAAKIARTFESPSTLLQVHDLRDSRSQLLATTANFDEHFQKVYVDYYWQLDVWAKRAAKIGLSKVHTSADLIADSEFERTEIYNDLVRAHDLFYVIGSVLPIFDHQRALIGIQRPRARGNYDEQYRNRLTGFIPHFVHALKIRRRLTQENLEHQAALDALERSRMAMMAVGRNGMVIYANREAEAMLHRGDAIRCVGGRLATTVGSASERLRLLIQGAVDTASGHQGSPGGTVSIAREKRLPVTVMVAPFRPARDGAGAPIPAAILFVRDTEYPPSPDSEAMQGLFGLTPAEATIASHLARGMSVAEIAARHRLSHSTVRTHLKNIFAKTDTRSQTQLVVLVVSSVAMISKR